MKRPTVLVCVANVGWIVAAFVVCCIAGWISQALNYGLAIDDEARIGVDMPPWYPAAAVAAVVATILLSWMAA